MPDNFCSGAYVGEYAELAKIASGKGGVADRSERFNLSEVRNHGEELSANLTIIALPKVKTKKRSI